MYNRMGNMLSEKGVHTHMHKHMPVSVYTLTCNTQLHTHIYSHTGIHMYTHAHTSVYTHTHTEPVSMDQGSHFHLIVFPSRYYNLNVSPHLLVQF